MVTPEREAPGTRARGLGAPDEDRVADGEAPFAAGSRPPSVGGEQEQGEHQVRDRDDNR